MEQDCIFCKIIKGDIPSFTVYEDDEFKVILDRFPASRGHMLVLPKKHYENVFEIDEETLGRLVKVAKKMATFVNEKFKPDGINILQNNGKAAGQSVFHYHMHIIPRYKNDEIKVGWKEQQLEIEELEKYYNELMGK